jgi:hypothetical protein
MRRSPEFSSNALESPAGEPELPLRAATLLYQGVTIAAMLLLLGSLWVF